MKTEIFTASVISYNCFEDIRYKLHLGAMATHEWIKNFTIEFEEEHSSISEWENYLDSLDEDYCDWEEYLISKVEERISQEIL